MNVPIINLERIIDVYETFEEKIIESDLRFSNLSNESNSSPQIAKKYLIKCFNFNENFKETNLKLFKELTLSFELEDRIIKVNF